MAVLAAKTLACAATIAASALLTGSALASAAPGLPGPGFPANYLGSLNPFTGHVSRVPVNGAVFNQKGLLFLG